MAGKLPLEVFDIQRNCDLPKHQDLAGVVLTGSNSMVTDLEPWSERIKPWVKEAVRKRLPILGVCYGHQLLAHALGGNVGIRSQGVEIGTVSITRTSSSEDDSLFALMPNQFYANSVHWQSVLRLPIGAVRLGCSDSDANHAFRIGDCAWGVQFHPEFTEAAMRFYVDAYEDVIREASIDLESLRKDIRSTSEANRLLQRFVDICSSKQNGVSPDRYD